MILKGDIMNERQVLLLSCCALTVILATSGCESHREEGMIEHTIPEPKPIVNPVESGLAEKPSELQDRPDSEVESAAESQTARVRTMEYIKMEDIWALRKQGACEKLIQATDNFLQAGRTDENTKGTCYFLKGDCQRQLGKFKEAEVTLQTVIADYNDAEWPDPNVQPSGYVLVRPQVDVGLRLVAERDRCRFPEDSNSYTTLAWKYLDRGKFDTSIFFAWECIRRFRTDAVKQQKRHVAEYKESLPKLWPEPKRNEGVLKTYWALYDVGTCCFIVGQAYEYQADEAVKRRDMQGARRFYEKAVTQYELVMTDYPAAQCFDPRGPWYWSVKQGAVERINRITDRKLKRMERG